MRRYIIRALVGIGLTAAAVSQFVSCEALAQEVEITESAITLSSGGGRAELWLQLADGTEHRVLFDDGSVEIDGTAVASYDPDADLASRWRELLRENAGADGQSVRDGLIDFREHLADRADEGSGLEARAARSLGEGLDQILGVSVDAPAEVATVEGPNGVSLQIAPGGLEFDFRGELDRLRGALGQLSDLGQNVDDLAMIVHDDFEIPEGREIEGNLAVLDGTLRLSGNVEGDVLVLDGTLRLEDGARIDGNILQVGGDIEFGDGSTVIRGEILSDFPVASIAPLAPRATPESPGEPPAPEASSRDRSSRDRDGVFRQFGRNVGHAAEGLMGAVTTFIGLAVLGLLLVYFAQGRLETVSDTVRHEFARSFAMGLAGQVLFFPALLVLVVLVITWPIVPFFVLGCGIAAVLGYLAVAHGAGEMFAQRRYRYEWLERLRRSNSYYYVVSGLVLLLLPFAAGAVLWVVGGTLDVVRGLIAFVACTGTWVLGTAGFGSVLLTRAGGRSVVVDWAPEPGGDADVVAEPDVAKEATEAEFTVDEDDDA